MCLTGYTFELMKTIWPLILSCLLLSTLTTSAEPVVPHALSRVQDALKKGLIKDFSFHLHGGDHAELHYHVMSYTVDEKLEGYYPGRTHVDGPAADGIMVLIHPLENVAREDWPIGRYHISAMRRYDRPYWHESRFLMELDQGGAVITIRAGNLAEPARLKQIMNTLLGVLRPDLAKPGTP
jgi:hypothetical protein